MDDVPLVRQVGDAAELGRLLAFGSDPAGLEYLQRAEPRLGSWRPGLQARVAEEWRAALSAAGH